MNYGEKVPGELDIEMAERVLEETALYWKGWLARSETGRTIDLGPYREKVNRCALALKLLYYDPEGTMAAAATTSLPEAIGGTRNWDYRYMWLRDASFTLNALFSLGHLSEMSGYMGFISRLITRDGAGRLQIMYGLRGETDLKELELLHLDGYKGSRPVRAGNAASKQFQLDIYGEVMDAAWRLSNYIGKIDAGMWPALRGVCDFVSENWRRPDSGIWEMRGGPFHFVHSKVMCWAALDRGLSIARAYGFPADLERWGLERGEIKEEVLRKGWNGEKGAFVQHYDTDALDASSLLIPMLGFLKPDDPRVASNLEAVRKELSIEGCFLYRYRTEDFLPGRRRIPPVHFLAHRQPYPARQDRGGRKAPQQDRRPLKPPRTLLRGVRLRMEGGPG